MKLNRFIVLATIALLVVGAMGVMTTRSFALGSQGPVAQTSAQTATCAQDQLAETAPDTTADTGAGIVGAQCGDQSALDSGVAETVGAETSASAEAASETANESKPSDGPNGPAVQVEQNGQNDGQFGQ